MRTRTPRRTRRAAAASARRLHRLERTRRRGPLARARTVLAVAAFGVAAAAVVAAMTGRLEVPTAPGVAADLARNAGAETSGPDLVVRIANGSGDDAMTAEVARLAREAGIDAHEVVAEASPASETRILVHRDTPAVVAAAADLRDLIGAGVVERVEATGDGADLTVILGSDALDPA